MKRIWPMSLSSGKRFYRGAYSDSDSDNSPDSWRPEVQLSVYYLRDLFEELRAEISRSPLEGELKHKAIALFNVPADLENTKTMVIDAFLSAYIKLLQLELTDDKIREHNPHWFRWIDEILDPVLNASIDELRDRPEDLEIPLNWIFQNRMVRILLCYQKLQNELCIRRCISKKTVTRILLLLKAEEVSLSPEQSSAMINGLIYRMQAFADINCDFESYHKRRARSYRAPGRPKITEGPIRDFCSIIGYAHSRNEGVLAKAFDISTMNTIIAGPDNGLDERVSQLSLLYIVARDEHKWDLINDSLGRLLACNRLSTSVKLLWLLKVLVDESAVSLENISQHFGTLMSLFMNSTGELRDAFIEFWKKVTKFPSVGPETHNQLEALKGFFLAELDALLAAKFKPPYTKVGKQRAEIENCLKGSSLLWFMRPHHILLVNTQERRDSDPVYRLGANLKLLAERELLSHLFYRPFSSVFHFSTYPDEPETEHDIGEILAKAFWLLIDAFSLDDLKQLKACEVSGWLALKTIIHRQKFCGELSKFIHKLIMERKQRDSPERFKYYIELISWRNHSRPGMEDIKLAETLLLRVFQDNRRARRYDSSHLVEYTQNVLSSPRIRPVKRAVAFQSRAGIGLLYLVRSIRYVKTFYNVVPLNFDDGFLGIQSRRMLLLSQCKRFIIGPVTVALTKFILEQFAKLEQAYGLRESQQYEPNQYDLLPTCLELAFPTGLDDPESPIYVCEFAYLRDALDHVERRHPASFKLLKAKLAAQTRRRLEYYQHEYDHFERCCRRPEVEATSNLECKCVGHARTIDAVQSRSTCPILKREYLCDYMSRHRSSGRCTPFYKNENFRPRANACGSL